MPSEPGTPMPEGSKVVSQRDGMVTVHVAMPVDQDGLIGRRCPVCERTFRLEGARLAALEDDQELTCPYCRLASPVSALLTGGQKARVEAAARALAQQVVHDACRDMARDLNRRGGPMRMEVPARRPAPMLPPLDEEPPVRVRVCPACRLRYAIFGDHVACPICGPLPPRDQALDALDAQDAVLAVLEGLSPDELARLREAGALDRAAASVLTAAVASVETYLGTVFRERVADADGLLAGKGNVFQRLDDTARLYREHLGVELTTTLTAEDWHQLRRIFGVRHLLTHTNGVVDAKHLERFPDDGLTLGQRVTISPAWARDVLVLSRRLVLGVSRDLGEGHASET